MFPGTAAGTRPSSCDFQSEVEQGSKGHRKRIVREWRERGMFELTEQHMFDQARAIRKNGWLSELELETIKRQVEDESQSELQTARDHRDCRN